LKFPIRLLSIRIGACLYDRASVERFWRILSSVNTVFNQFRARFIGKSSPVHFFWGSFDLAVTGFQADGHRSAPAPMP